MALMRCTGLHMDVPGMGKGQRAKVKKTVVHAHMHRTGNALEMILVCLWEVWSSILPVCLWEV